MNPIPFLRTRFHEVCAHRPEIMAVLLVGSYAREQQRSDSDVDVMILASDPRSLTEDTSWLGYFGPYSEPKTEIYGSVKSIRVNLFTVEFEFSVASTTWLELPLDSGTRRVLGDGYQILSDPNGILSSIISEVPPIDCLPAVPNSVELYWQEFLDSRNDPLNQGRARFNWFQFGASPNDLADLVVKGVKRGTSSLLASWQHERSEVPKSGTFSVVLDALDRPKCVIELEKVEVLRYDEFDESRAAKEGEGTGRLSSWKELHADFFASECNALGRKMSESELIVFESFRLVYGGTI